MNLHCTPLRWYGDRRQREIEDERNFFAVLEQSILETSRRQLATIASSPARWSHYPAK
jgi:hypothetical protein